jgi:hypothetical protein
VNRYQGCHLYILLFYVSTLLLSVDSLADSTAAPAIKNDSVHSDSASSIDSEIEEGWVEKKIAPSTQWVESIFAPFTQWMENEIQQEPNEYALQPSVNRPNNRLISVQQAVNTVLKNHQGTILRSQFKTGPPPYYKIKTLSDKGAVSIFYINAFTGNPFLPSSIIKKIKEAKP